MRAILINPSEHSITEIEIAGDLASKYKAMDCSLVTIIDLGQNEILWADDEGLLKGSTDAFELRDYPSPIAGNCLILGDNEEGDSVSTKLSVEAVEHLVVSFGWLKL